MTTRLARKEGMMVFRNDEAELVEAERRRAEARNAVAHVRMVFSLRHPA